MATAFCYGCNLGPSQTSRSLDGLDRRQIAWVNRRHVTEEKLDEAVVALIDAYNRFSLPKLWGSGKHASADGTKWNPDEQNLLSEYHVRYGGYGGIGYYHVSDTYVALFSHFIPCGVWEAVYLLDGLLKNRSDIQPDTIYAATRGRPNSRVTSRHLGQSSGIRAFMSSSKRPYGIHVFPDQRRQRAQVAGRQASCPVRLRQHLLEHERVDVDHAVLEQVQRQHADLVVFAAVAGHFAAAGEEDEVGGAVPLLDDVQPFVDLAPQLLVVQVAAQEDGFDRLAEFGERLVGRVLHVVSREAAQDRLGLGRAQAHRRRVFDHLVVLLADQLPVDRLASGSAGGSGRRRVARCPAGTASALWIAFSRGRSWKPSSRQKANATVLWPWESTYCRSTSISVQWWITPSIMDATSDEEGDLSWEWMHSEFRSTCQ